MRRLRCACLASLLCLLTGLVHAQQEPPASDQQVTTIRASANLVLVDVVVTDHGNAIHGLDPHRFHLMEDGHEVPITYFDERRSDTQPAAPVAVKATPLPPHVYSNQPTFPDTPAVNILLLDSLNTPVADQMTMHQQALKYMKTMTPGTQLAIFSLGMRLRLVHGFSWDDSTLEAAMLSPEATMQPTVALDVDKDQVLNQGLVNAMGAHEGAGGRSAIGGMQNMMSHLADSQRETESYNADERTQITLEAMQEIARYLSALPGRKNIIWFSGSFPMSLLPTGGSSLSKFMSTRNYSQAVQQTCDMLSAIHAAVYPVYASGVQVLDTTEARNKGTIRLGRSGLTDNASGGSPGLDAATAMRNSIGDDSDFLERMEEAQETMKRVAEQTGGEAYMNTNALADAIGKAVLNGSSYYTIGYDPGRKPRGSFHGLKVSVEGGHYQLEYRHGFYVDDTGSTGGPSSDVFDPLQAAVLHGAPPSSQVLFSTRVLTEGDPELAGHVPKGPSGTLAKDLKGATREVSVEMKIDGTSLLFEQTANGSHRDRLECVLIGYDSEGKRVNFADTAYDELIGPKDFMRAMSSGMVMRGALTMPAGRGSVRLVVRDVNSGRIGAIEVPVQSMEQQAKNSK